MAALKSAFPACKFPAHSEPRVWLISAGESPTGIALSRELLAHGDSVVYGIKSSGGYSDDLDEFWNEEVLVKEGWKERSRMVRLDARCERGTRGKGGLHGTSFLWIRCSRKLTLLLAIIGTVEELGATTRTTALMREQFEIVYFGQVNLIKAALPSMREQQLGHVMLLTGITGHLGTPGLGAYCASQWAIEGFCDRVKLLKKDQSLAYEVAPFNIKVTIVQPNVEIGVLTNPIIAAPQLPQYKADNNPAPLFRDILGGLLDRLEPSNTGERRGVESSDNDPARLSSDKIVSIRPQLPEHSKRQLVAETIHSLTAIGGHDNPPARHIVGHEGVASVKEKLKTVSEELEDFVEASCAVDIEQQSAGPNIPSDRWNLIGPPKAKQRAFQPIVPRMFEADRAKPHGPGLAGTKSSEREEHQICIEHLSNHQIHRMLVQFATPESFTTAMPHSIRSLASLLFTASTLQSAIALPQYTPENTPQNTTSNSTTTTTSGWPGWENISNLFIFGASYAGTGFNWLEGHALPFPSNPLGNTDRGTTSSNGPNFVTYLTTTFNASYIQTYNFAFPGAKVSTTASSTNLQSINKGNQNDMVMQVKGFTESYTPAGPKPPRVEWTGGDSLFISFFPINDILASYARADPDTVTNVFNAYTQNLEQLYTGGARNFLILNTPPMDLLPAFASGQGAKAAQIPFVANNQTLVTQAVDRYNAALPAMVTTFSSSHPDTKVFTFDVHNLFTTMTSSSSAANTLTQKYGLKPLVDLKNACDAYIRFDANGKRVDYLGEDDFRDER
ncbi:MAG: hypothetical protein Q9174_004753, partial [Haloplaca sp. 1 TL-2023]